VDLLRVRPIHGASTLWLSMLSLFEEEDNDGELAI
jgi:hypothetical protein